MSVVEDGAGKVKPIMPNYDNLSPPTDSFKTHRFTNIGAKVKESFGSAEQTKQTGALALNKAKELGAAFLKFKDSPNTKLTKKEKCYWLAALCFLVAIAVIVGLSVAFGPAGMLMAVGLAAVPLAGGVFLFSKGRREGYKEKKLKEWMMPKIKGWEYDPSLSKKDNEMRKTNQLKGEGLWNSRNTAKVNMETNLKRITEIKTEMKSPKLAEGDKVKLQEELKIRENHRAEDFKKFEDTSVAFWDFAKPERGAALKERFNEARESRGEELFKIAKMEDLLGTEEKGDLPAG